MKSICVLLLSVITIAHCTVPSVFLKPGTEGKNCICREKECTDVSCEEKNCLCLVKGLRGLHKKEKCGYEKSLVNDYLQMVQERCLCIQGCQKICNPDEFNICSNSAFDRFLCKYQDYLSSNKDKKGYKEFVADVKDINTECINKDCKPVCSGNGDCDPFSLPLDNCDHTKECVNSHIKSLTDKLKDPAVKEQLKEFRISCSAFYDQMANCGELMDQRTKYICTMSANSGFSSQVQSFNKNLMNVAGPCTATSILSAVKQGVAECALV